MHMVFKDTSGDIELNHDPFGTQSDFDSSQLSTCLMDGPRDWHLDMTSHEYAETGTDLSEVVSSPS
jgi:hypothetical protein